MIPIRKLVAALLVAVGTLSWGPPTVLAVCLRGGTCAMAAKRHSGTAPCCRREPAKGISVEGDRHGDCCGCCAALKVGLGIDGGQVRVETPVPPPAPAPSLAATLLPAAEGAAVPAGPEAPRPPPERVLPLRI